MLGIPSFHFLKHQSRFYSSIPKDLLNLGINLRTKEGPIATNEFFKGKKVVLIGIPGAFTAVCSKQIPEYASHINDLKKKGIDAVAVVSVNDHHVMDAWRENMGVESDKINFLADPDGSFTRAIGMEIDLSAAGLCKRSNRYALIVDNGRVLSEFLESSPIDAKVSSAKNVIEKL